MKAFATFGIIFVSSLFFHAAYAQNTFPASGNVGIGTTSPTALLNVNATNQTTGEDAVLFDKVRGVSTAGTRYTFNNVGGLTSESLSPFWRGFHFGAPYITISGSNVFPRLGVYAEYDSYTNPTTKRWVIDANNSNGYLHDIQFRAETVNLLYLRSDGSVGIGTTNPGTFKLAVEGKIGAREVQVLTTSPFPDYVFDPTYRLRSLFNLEQYINQYKHLPGIPSATEVANQGGVELGKMNTSLLEKVEELTLYVIELNKKVEKLEKENEALRGE